MKSVALSLLLKVEFLELGNGLLAHQDPHLASTNRELPANQRRQAKEGITKVTKVTFFTYPHIE